MYRVPLNMADSNHDNFSTFFSDPITNTSTWKVLPGNWYLLAKGRFSLWCKHAQITQAPSLGACIANTRIDICYVMAQQMQSFESIMNRPNLHYGSLAKESLTSSVWLNFWWFYSQALADVCTFVYSSWTFTVNVRMTRLTLSPSQALYEIWCSSSKIEQLSTSRTFYTIK